MLGQCGRREKDGRRKERSKAEGLGNEFTA
jgi:hypothetical protein